MNLYATSGQAKNVHLSTPVQEAELVECTGGDMIMVA